MDILYLLVPLSVALVFVIGIFFRSAIRGGQFEDLEGPAYRILMDDDSLGGEAMRENQNTHAGSAGKES
jgi:cbb3-type cytochrome oxidase maturation protein